MKKYAGILLAGLFSGGVMAADDGAVDDVCSENDRSFELRIDGDQKSAYGVFVTGDEVIGTVTISGDYSSNSGGSPRMRFFSDRNRIVTPEQDVLTEGAIEELKAQGERFCADGSLPDGLARSPAAGFPPPPVLD